MLTKNINFKNFYLKKNNQNIKKDLKKLLKENNVILNSLSTNYKNSYSKNVILKIKNYKNIRVIGMGGSILGTEAIFDFLKPITKKDFEFVNNLKIKKNSHTKKNKKLNVVVSKSGNTLETISNSNILIKKNDKNIFITENKESYLFLLAKKLKAEVVHHNNFIGGRFSVLSEVGMLPAELMGFNPIKFKQLNNLIKNKKFMKSLLINVSNTLFFLKNKKFNSIILNYDESSNNLFKWYQQLIAESLGKKGNGILPLVSTMPKDNHSLMQLYLDGPKNNFFTFFYVKEKKPYKIINERILPTHNYLINKDLNQVIYAQKIATENIFLKKKIPFRSFEVNSRDEKTLGDLFIFFIFETILLARALKLDPYNQPSVELIKTETKKILI